MKSKICFVIPVYNRSRNLSAVLLNLAAQTVQDFSVVVADDGSEDDSFCVVQSMAASLDIQYVWHVHRGYRVAFTRNCGMQLAPKDTTHIWQLDSDVILRKDAVQAAYDLIEQYPEDVICGRYDWLPPMVWTFDDILSQREEFWQGRLPWPDDVPRDADYGGRPSGEPLHLDPRTNVDWSSNTSYLCSEAMLSGNLIIPMGIVKATGGFDESIEAQGSDSEFGRHCASLGYQMRFSDAIRGVHLYHYRNVREMVMGVRETIRYIHRKYGLGEPTESQLPKVPGE